MPSPFDRLADVLVDKGASLDASGILIVKSIPSGGVGAFNFGPDNADGEAVNATNLDLLVKARLEALGTGATWDRLRSGMTDVNNTRTGILNVISMLSRTLGGTANAQLAALSIADAMTGEPFGVAGQMLYNEATFDRRRNNTQGTLLASAARTVTTLTPNQTNYNARGVAIFVVITAIAGTTPSLQPQIAAIDPVTANLVLGSSIASLTATGSYLWVIYPGDTGNAASSWQTSTTRALPRIWAVNFNIAGTTPSVTFSAGYSYIL